MNHTPLVGSLDKGPELREHFMLGLQISVPVGRFVQKPSESQGSVSESTFSVLYTQKEKNKILEEN